eukprot:Skav213779  [mRNA]  locus=scaffold3228:208834:214393:+ [translate_table: standard]
MPQGCRQPSRQHSRQSTVLLSCGVAGVELLAANAPLEANCLFQGCVRCEELGAALLHATCEDGRAVLAFLGLHSRTLLGWTKEEAKQQQLGDKGSELARLYHPRRKSDLKPLGDHRIQFSATGDEEFNDVDWTLRVLPNWLQQSVGAKYPTKYGDAKVLLFQPDPESDKKSLEYEASWKGKLQGVSGCFAEWNGKREVAKGLEVLIDAKTTAKAR